MSPCLSEQVLCEDAAGAAGPSLSLAEFLNASARDRLAFKPLASARCTAFAQQLLLALQALHSAQLHSVLNVLTSLQCSLMQFVI